MINHIPYSSLYFADHGWLKSRFHFSFGEYRNYDNIQYGPLRVMNDDLIAGHTGFDTHPHKDMEIITYVIKGELTHQDNMGNKKTLTRGDVQYLSAGTGIIHSEKNDSDEEIHLIQTWILPQKNLLTPQYGSKIFDEAQRKNKWLHIVGPKGSQAEIFIYQDANMYVSEIEADSTLTFDLKENRQLYLKVMEGDAIINKVNFNFGDAAEITNEAINIKATNNTHLLLVEMKQE